VKSRGYGINRKREKMRRIFKVISIGLLFLIILYGLIEIGLRISWRISPDFSAGEDGFGLWRNHPLLGIAHNPGYSVRLKFKEHPHGYFVYKINKQGLREDKPVSFEKTKIRILVVGDSHTDGIVNNDESFPNKLEQLTRCDAINAGVAAYGPLKEYLWLKLYSDKYNPDIVIVAFYVGNDLGDMIEPPSCPSLKKVNNRYKIIPPKDRRFPKMLKYSLLYAYIFEIIYAKENFEKGPIGQSGTFQSLMQNSPNEEEAYNRMDYVFDLFSELTTNLNCKLLFLIIPTKIQIEGMDTASKRKLKKFWRKGMDLSYTDKVRGRVLKMLSEKGIKNIDLYPYFKDEYKKTHKPLFWNADHHLNIHGHSLTAEILYKRLNELGWLK